MTRHNATDADTQAEPITLTVEIDPTEFDEPREMMFERLVEEYGQETIAELVGANLQQDMTAQGMGVINALWDNRDQIQPGSDASETDGLTEPREER
jgi:hypothetical protein